MAPLRPAPRDQKIADLAGHVHENLPRLPARDHDVGRQVQR
jgi:hypothetical protein